MWPPAGSADLMRRRPHRARALTLAAALGLALGGCTGPSTGTGAPVGSVSPPSTAAPAGSSPRPAVPGEELRPVDHSNGDIFRPYAAKPDCAVFADPGATARCGRITGANAANQAVWVVQTGPGGQATAQVWTAAARYWALVQSSADFQADAVRVATGTAPGAGQVIVFGFHVGSELRVNLVNARGALVYRATLPGGAVDVSPAGTIGLFYRTPSGIRQVAVAPKNGSWQQVQAGPPQPAAALPPSAV